MKRQAQSRVSVLLAVMAAGVFVIFAFGQPSTTAALQSNFVGGEPSRPGLVRHAERFGCASRPGSARTGTAMPAGRSWLPRRAGAARRRRDGEIIEMVPGGRAVFAPAGLVHWHGASPDEHVRAAHRPRWRRRRADLLVRPRERGGVPGPVACRLRAASAARRSPRRVTEPTVRAVTLADTLPAVRGRLSGVGSAPKRYTRAVRFPLASALRQRVPAQSGMLRHARAAKCFSRARTAVRRSQPR